MDDDSLTMDDDSFAMDDDSLTMDDDSPTDYWRIMIPRTINKCKKLGRIDRGIDIDDIVENDGKVQLRILGCVQEAPAGAKRANLFLNNLVKTTTFQKIAPFIVSVDLCRVELDHWHPLMGKLKKYGAPLEELSFKYCHFSQQADSFLSFVLNRAKKRFIIKHLELWSIKGSKEYIEDGILRNRSITHLEVHDTLPVINDFIPIIQKSRQLKKVEFMILKGDHEEEGKKDNIMGNADETRNLDLVDEECNLEELCITSEHQLSLGFCQSIGKVLRRSKNLKELYLDASEKNMPYDFMRDAIHCRKITLSEVNCDLHAIASHVIPGKGKLKDLTLIRQPATAKIAQLLEHVDICSLDRFEIDEISNDDVKDHPLCHYLKENKGPKKLVITVLADLNYFLQYFAPNMMNNNKIEELDVTVMCNTEGDDAFRQFINLVESMPRLRAWRLALHSAILYEEEFLEDLPRWYDYIAKHVQSCWRIQKIKLQFPLRNDIKKMLFQNKWKMLLRSQPNELPCGIWSHALGRIPRENKDLIFNVVSQVPSLFQQAASRLQHMQLPCFGVAHHPNCPACRKRKRYQFDA